jgi:hypothetical protein
VLAYDEFVGRVTLRKPPPWEKADTWVADTRLTDHHETMARAWFQTKKIRPTVGDVGKLSKRLPSTT